MVGVVDNIMKFELIKKVPIVEIGGKRCFLDTGFPHASMPVAHGVQEFFGIPGLQVAGVKALKRYTKFDYRNSEIITSDEPISLEGGTAVPLEVRPNGWLVKMTVGGVEGMRYIDTGAAFSYMHNLSKDFPSDGNADECAFDGRPWTAPMRRVPCEFAPERLRRPARWCDRLRLLQQLHSRRRPYRREDDIHQKLKGRKHE